MAMSAFLRRNLVPVLGLALPLLLVLALALSRSIVAARVAPPAYDLLLVSSSYVGIPLEFSVEQGRLQVRYLPGEEATRLRLRTLPQLLYLDVNRFAVRAVPLVLPVDEDGQLPQQVLSIDVPELAGLTLSADSVAPDGYRFERVQQSGGLFQDLFGGRSPYQYVLAKGGRRIALHDAEQRNNIALLAWVIAGDAQQSPAASENLESKP